jgi:hypothetical protein
MTEMTITSETRKTPPSQDGIKVTAKALNEHNDVHAPYFSTIPIPEAIDVQLNTQNFLPQNSYV